MHEQTLIKTITQILNEIYNPLSKNPESVCFSLDKEYITFDMGGDHWGATQSMSIYKLMSLSKILASTKGYDIFSRPKINRKDDFKYALAIVSFGEEEKHCTFRINPLATFTGDTEFEAVITAMYFVLNDDEEES